MARKKSVKPAKDNNPKGDPAKFWTNELKAAEKREERWQKRAQKIVQRYRDERDGDGSERRTNILWSNTEILKSVLFQKVGTPDVRRRFPKRGKDEARAKTAALVLERAISYCIDDYDADAQISCVVEDHLLPGRGQAWVVYDADVVEAAKGDADEDEPDTVAETDDDGSETEAVDIADQRVRLEHVFWKDYRTSNGRKETDIWWKARAHTYSRRELDEYFPDHAAHVPMDAEEEGGSKDTDGDGHFKRARVWEIWDKSKKERLYVAEGYPLILKRDEDPYRLKTFFPCPSALYGVKTTSSLVPIPEYTLYQDQCEELDVITTRLNRLIEALKRRGVYDASIEGADNQISKLAYADDNEFLPYKGMATLMEKGGLANVFQSEDLRPIVAVVQQLYEQRAMLIQTIYEVTGISDVVRGSSNPNETATAQRIKGQFGSLRVTSRQSRVNGFVRDAYRLKAEIIAEHFTREKLQEMTGIDMPLESEKAQAKQQLQMISAMQSQAQQAQQRPPQEPPQPGQPGQPPVPMVPQMPPMPPPDPEMIKQLEATAKAPSWEEVSDILRSDQRRGYKIDIETEDTAMVDADLEKQRRIEFMTTMQPVMEGALALSAQGPEMLPLAKETVLFTLKSFKVGRQLEEAFEEAFDKLSSRPPPEKTPDPEQLKLQIEQKRLEGDMQIKQQSAAADMEMKKFDMELKKIDQELKKGDLMLKQAELQIKSADLEGRRAEQAMKSEQLKLDFMGKQIDIEGKQIDIQGRAAQHQRDNEAHSLKVDEARSGFALKVDDANFKRQTAAQSYRDKSQKEHERAQKDQEKANSDGQTIKQLMMAFGDLKKSNEAILSALNKGNGNNNGAAAH